MEDYIRENEILDLSEEEQKLQVLKSILKTRNDLKQAHINFEFAEDELVDFYSYQIKANQAKLDYLTRLAKTLNLESLN